MPDMTNSEIAEAADLTWRYIGPGQENLTRSADREKLAQYAELYTDEGMLLLAMSRRQGLTSTWWGPDHSEILSRKALAQVPYVDRIDQVDLAMMLDLETDTVRSAS